MRRVDGRQQQRKPRLLPARQPPDHGFRLIRAKAETRQPRPQPGLALIGPHPLDMLKRRFVQIQLIDLMLGEIADPKLRGAHHLAVDRRKLARQQLRQRGLALAVAAQKRDPVVLVDPQRQAPQDRLAVIADRDAIHGDDRRRQGFGHGEGEDLLLRFFRRHDRRHLFQHLYAALRLDGLRGLGLEAVDEALQMRPPRFLLLGLGRLHGALFGALAGELVIGPGPERELAVFQMQDRAHGAVQQPPVVADDQHRMGILGQIAFQPQGTFQIEVVRRFVQQQQIRLREQHPRQRHAHPPPARKIGTGHQRFFRREAQALQDRTGAALGRPGVDIGQPVLDVGDPVRVGRGFGLGHQARAFGIGSKHRIQQRGRG